MCGSAAHFTNQGLGTFYSGIGRQLVLGPVSAAWLLAARANGT